MDELVQLRAMKGFTDLRLQFINFPDRVKAEIAESNARYAVKVWPGALQEQGPSSVQQRVLTDGADVRPNNLGVTLRAATSGASLSGGLNTSGRRWAGFEFGATPSIKSVTRLGKRRDQLINVQFAPRRTAGKIVYPAAVKLGPVMVGRWVKAVVKAIAAGNKDLKTR